MTKAHKEITSKRKKSDDDHEAIAKSEWRSGLYFDEEMGPFIPGVSIFATLISGGKLSKMGAQLKRSVDVLTEKAKLEYKGPRTIEKLWEQKFYDARSVKVQTARLMRYRPIFRDWACSVEIVYDKETINKEQVLKCLEDGGTYCGIGDYRPNFGRFKVEVLNG